MAAKVERRRTTVTLYPGNYEQELSSLLDRTMEAQRDEDDGSARRMGSPASRALDLAKEYDALLAKATASGIEVTLWAISYLEWGPLADGHPPREGNEDDASFGVNMKTFPPVLLRAALVAPGEAVSVADIQAKGDRILAELGDISRVHYVKLERAAWNVNVGDDSLPKFSLESLVRQQRDPDSSQPNDSE